MFYVAPKSANAVAVITVIPKLSVNCLKMTELNSNWIWMFGSGLLPSVVVTVND